MKISGNMKNYFSLFSLFFFLILLEHLPLSEGFRLWISSIPVVLLYLLFSCFLGYTISKVSRLPANSHMTMKILFTLIGLGSLGLLHFSLGLLGIANHVYIIYGLLLIIIVAVNLWKRRGKSGQKGGVKSESEETISAKKKTEREKSFSRLTVMILSTVIILLFSCFALLPEGFHDSLLYHLSVPQQMLITGNLTPMEHNFTTYLPLNGEMLYLPIAFNDYACRFFQLSLTLMIMALIYFSFRKHGRFPALLAALLPFSIWEFAFASVTTLVENSVGLFALGGWLFLKEYIKTGDRKFVILAGFLTGFAGGVKYQGLILGFAMMIAMFVYLIRNSSFRKTAGVILLFALTLFLAFFPWMLRSYLLTGNPLFPALGSVFESKVIEKQDLGLIMEIWGYQEPGMRSAWGFISTPFKSALKSGGLAVLLLPLLMSLFIYRERRKTFKGLFIILGLFYLFWFFLAPHPRYFLPAVPFLVLIAAESIVIIKEKKNLFIPYLILLGGVFLFNFIPVVSALNRILAPGIFYTNTFDRHFYFSMISNYPHQAIEFVNSNTPVESRILLVGESRGCNLRREYHASSPYERQLLSDYLDKAADSGDLASLLVNDGFDYILINYSEWTRTRDSLNLPAMDFAPRGSRNLQVLSELTSSLEKVYRDKTTFIYRIKEPD